MGIPQGGTRWPSYALLQVEDGAVSIELLQVPYDITAVIRAQFESGLVNYGNCWAIGVLYAIITGEDYPARLLEKVCRNGDVRDEELWHAEAEKMGMKFTEREIIGFLKHKEVQQ